MPTSGYGGGGFGDAPLGGYTTPSSVCLAIQKVIRTLLNMPDGSVRTSQSGGPVGETSFATVKIVSFAGRGWDSSTFENLFDEHGATTEQITETVEGERHAVASIQFFKQNAETFANILSLRLQSGIGATLLNNMGLGVSKIGEPKNIAALVNTLWEDRWGLDIEFSVIAGDASTQNTFGNFPVTVKSEEGNNSFTIESN